MIRHIVLFTLTATSDTERAADISGMQERLGALVGVIPGLKAVTLKPDLGLIEGHWDVALVSEHDDNAALEAYQAHPAHLEAGAFIRSVTADRATVDYEL
ncbi:MAG: Dabb family protein [Salinibacterium sp.]|nr:Dabb family protein [Salinibacterium sp.]